MSAKGVGVDSAVGVGQVELVDNLQSVGQVEPISHGAFTLGGQMWGSLHPSEGVPPPGRAAGDRVFTHHPLLGAIFLDGPRARVGLGWAGTGWSQASGSLQPFTAEQPRMKKERGHQANNPGSNLHSDSSKLWDLKKVPNPSGPQFSLV